MMKDDDFKLLKGFALRRTDERTNGRTFVIVESLSRLKNKFETSFNHLFEFQQCLEDHSLLF